jgi:hypothetical protein
MRTSPWHSIEKRIYHVSTDCSTGKGIEPEKLRHGTGGKPMCKECREYVLRDAAAPSIVRS